MRNFKVVHIRHREVRVAPNADLGQMDEGDIAAMAVHEIPPLLGHFEKNSPLFLAGIRTRFVRDVVTVVDDNRYLRELHEIRLGRGDSSQRSAAERQGSGHVPLRERKVEARLGRITMARTFLFLMAVRHPSHLACRFLQHQRSGNEN
jgi:hypothetical protein